MYYSSYMTCSFHTLFFRYSPFSFSFPLRGGSLQLFCFLLFVLVLVIRSHVLCGAA